MPGHGDLNTLSNLVDPVRRQLYEFVCAADGPVTREQAASGTGIARNLAAYHLDKLTEAGLLRADYARPAGRTGPGAGRPAKQYVQTDREVSVSVPSRDYLLMAEVLAQAIEDDDTGAVRRSAAGIARRAGRAAGRDEDLRGALRQCGYQPQDGADGTIQLKNCPFHQLSRRHTDLVCSLNMDLIDGILESTGPSWRAELRPCPDRCCVTLHPAGKG